MTPRVATLATRHVPRKALFAALELYLPSVISKSGFSFFVKRRWVLQNVCSFLTMTNFIQARYKVAFLFLIPTRLL